MTMFSGKSWKALRLKVAADCHSIARSKDVKGDAEDVAVQD